jgi:hypothetical protein
MSYNSVLEGELAIAGREAYGILTGEVRSGSIPCDCFKLFFTFSGLA